jgi:hypothetical protein
MLAAARTLCSYFRKAVQTHFMISTRANSGFEIGSFGCLVVTWIWFWSKPCWGMSVLVRQAWDYNVLVRHSLIVGYTGMYSIWHTNCWEASFYRHVIVLVLLLEYIVIKGYMDYIVTWCCVEKCGFIGNGNDQTTLL